MPHVIDEVNLKEKYLHSQGAALYEEGLYDQAIDFFTKAVALDDQPYTRYHLCLTYIAIEDTEKALREINRAIELNPSVAKYYHRRGRIWQSLGDTARASEDQERALKLDANYARVEEIRSTYASIEQAFSNVQILDWCATAQVKHTVLKNVVREFKKSLIQKRDVIETASCALPCPAYCCHFEGEPVRHGVHIGAWKLQAIRSFLKAQNLSEQEFLGMLRYSGEEHLIRLIPPHYVVSERGESLVYYPKRGGKRLGKARLKGLPKAKDYQELLWINENSRACAFLHRRKCMIHDLGGEPGLPACKEFLCMTGFVFAVLEHHGLIEKPYHRMGSMPALNHFSITALLLLGRTLYNERLTQITKKRFDSIKDAVDADSRGAADEIDSALKGHRRITEDYQKLFQAQREKITREMASLH